MKKIKIAFCRFMHETHSFSTAKTKIKDFERTHFLEGNELLEACKPKNWEVKGFLKNMELSGFMKYINKQKKFDVELIPLFSAWSVPGGPIPKEDFEFFVNKLKKQLTEAGKIDGVYFAAHGAMGVDGIEEPEAEIFSIIRNIVGKIPISVSFDLHANITLNKLKNIDIVCAYRSNPHWDMFKIGYKATELLIKTINQEIKPVLAWRSLPMIIGGGNTVSLFTPMNKIFQRMSQMEKYKDVLHCSTFMCHPWNKNKDLGWATVILTNNNKELAEIFAEELAVKSWELRNLFPPKMLNTKEMLQKIEKHSFIRKISTITISDASDVVGAGSTGENTAILKAFIENDKNFKVYIPIRDIAVVEKLWQEDIGKIIDTFVGGKMQKEYYDPIEIKAKLISKNKTDNFGKVIVLEINGSISLVVTEGIPLSIKPSFYEDIGLKVKEADAVIVKSLFHYRIYYLLKSFKSLYVRTKGLTDFDVAHAIETNSPIHPRDKVENWKKIDLERRKLSNLDIKNEIKVLENNHFFIKNAQKKKSKKKQYITLITILIGIFFIIKKLKVK